MATTGAGVNAAASEEPQSGVSRIDWRREVGLPVAAALGLGALILGWAQFIPSQGMTYWLVGATLASLPVMALSMYRRAARQAGRTLWLAEDGRLHPWANGRVFGTVLISVVTFPMAMLALAVAARYEAVESVLLLLGMAVLVILNAALRRPLGRESRLPRVAECWAGHASIFISAVLLCLGTYAIRIWLGIEAEFETIQEARAHFEEKHALDSASQAVTETQLWLAGFESFRSYALGYVDYWAVTGLSVLVVVLLDFGSYVFLLTVAAACALPLAEYRWIVANRASEGFPVLSKARLVWVPLLSAIILLTLSYGVARFADDTFIYARDLRKATEAWTAEIIDNEAYEPGTLVAIDELDAAYERRKDAAVDQAEEMIEAQFDSYRERVDDFLDWNYSLSTDVVLTAAAATGNLAETLQENLEAKIVGDVGLAEDERRDVFSKLDQTLNALEAQRLRDRVVLLAERRLQVNSIRLSVTEESQLKALEGSLIAERVKYAQGRMIASVAVGTLAPSLFRGSRFEALEKKLKNIVAKRGAASAVGQGATWLIPGAGWLLRPLLRPVIGVAVAKAAVEVDEYLHRDEMKAEIIELLNDAESQTLAPLQELRSKPEG